jgi:hypothetical protein
MSVGGLSTDVVATASTVGISPSAGSKLATLGAIEAERAAG